MPKSKVKAKPVYIHIKWDTTDEDHPKGRRVPGLPRKVKIPEDVLQEYYTNDQDCDILTGYLSDKYGWLVAGWSW